MDVKKRKFVPHKFAHVVQWIERAFPKPFRNFTLESEISNSFKNQWIVFVAITDLEQNSLIVANQSHKYLTNL